jgi:hypothetical protein
MMNTRDATTTKMTKTMMTMTVMNEDNDRGEGKWRGVTKNNNQLMTVYRGGVTGNDGAREGGKEGEGRVGNKMTGGRGA